MIRVMTSNIWGDYFGNEVQVREDQLFEVYSKYAPARPACSTYHGYPVRGEDGRYHGKPSNAPFSTPWITL